MKKFRITSLKQQPVTRGSLFYSVLVSFVLLPMLCHGSVLTANETSAMPASTTESLVLKLVDVKGDPPCSTWGNITSCDPKAGTLTWGPSTNTTYTWTVPPQQIGPEGISISLNASESNPPNNTSATGLRLTAKGFDLSGDKPDIAIGAPSQPLSGGANVTLKPKPGATEYVIRIGVYYGPAYNYTYRAEAAPKPPSGPNKPRVRNTLRVVDVTGDGFYIQGGTGSVRPLLPDTVLKEGDRVTTDPTGSVTLAFADSSTVVLEDATDFDIREYFTEGGVVHVEIMMKMGEIRAKVQKENRDERGVIWKIKTPTFDAGVRGTVFTVRYDPQTKTSTATVTEGAVEVTPTNKSLAPVTLRAGQQVQVTPTRIGKVTSTATRATKN